MENNSDNRWIKWDKKFEVGYKRVDEQHMELVRIINELYAASEEGDLYDSQVKEKFKALLKRTVDYATYHFATEEKIMKAINYSRFKEHILRHREFSNKVLDEIIKYTNGNDVNMESLIVYLRDWLLNHISVEDKTFVDELKKTLKEMETKGKQ